MKKILSLFLATVMVFGLVSMTASAEGETPAFENSCNLSLGDDISLTYYLTGLDADTTYWVVVKDAEGNVVGDGKIPVENGTAKLTGLTPLDVATVYTATLVDTDNNTYDTLTTSVKDVCVAYLNNMTFSDDVHALAASLLKYADAVETWQNSSNDSFGTLSQYQQDLAVATPPAPQNGIIEGESPDGATVNFKAATMNLQDRIYYRFYFETEANLAELKFVVTLNDTQYPIQQDTYGEEDESYYFEFDQLNPAQLSEDVTVVAVDANNNPISETLTYSADRYAYSNTDTSVNDVIDAIRAYNAAAIDYNSNPDTTHTYVLPSARDIRTSGALTAHEIYRLFKSDKLDDVSCTNLSDLPTYIYGLVGVDVSGYINANVSNVGSTLFSSYGLKVTEGVWYDMLVPDSWSGVRFTNEPEKQTLIKPDAMTFEPGDIFCLQYLRTSDNKQRYFVAIYVGNNRFATTGKGVYDSVDALMDRIETLVPDDNNWTYSWVLRPNNVAQGLPLAKQEALAGLTTDVFTGWGGTKNLEVGVKAVYGAIGIDMSPYVDGYSVNSARSEFGGKNGLYDPATKPAAEKWLPMVVQYGYGTMDLVDNCVIGDIVCFRDAVNTSNYFVAFYQGEDKFLTNSNTGDGVYSFTQLCALGSANWQYYYVLRPANVLYAN